MTLMEGLSAANLALSLVKDLRDIDRSVDEAAFKLKLAEITAALSDANLQLNDRQLEIRSLKDDLAQGTTGELCPKCLVGRMKLTKTEQHFRGGLSNFGVEDWTFRCDQSECEFEQTTMHDPHGAIPKLASSR